MKNKFAPFYLLGLAIALLGTTGVAFGQRNNSNVQRNIPGFRGLNQWHHKVTPQPPAPAGPNTDCTLILPKNPLSAQGLATPFLLTATNPADGPCNEANNAQSAFVQAGIIDPVTGKVWVYNPLVIDKGATPAVAPVPPALPPNAIVALWFGYNADNLTLKPSAPFDLLTARCVNGLPGSEFSQFSYCNAPAFFKAANASIANQTLVGPALLTGSDTLPCPTVRDFFIVDQDQSDNLPTTYLITPNGLAQDTAANRANFPTATVLGNPSDNHLLDAFVDPALGCQPWTAPDLTDQNNIVASPALYLNELQARTEQPTPVALIPGNDPMSQLSGNESLLKTNLYRLGVDQPIANSFFDIDPARYCRQYLRIAPQRIMITDMGQLKGFNTPDAGAGNSLFTFMAARFVSSYEILNCEKLIQQPNPITITTDTNGVAIGATINPITYAQQISDIAGQKAADDAADNAALSLQTVE